MRRSPSCRATTIPRSRAAIDEQLVAAFGQVNVLGRPDFMGAAGNPIDQIAIERHLGEHHIEPGPAGERAYDDIDQPLLGQIEIEEVIEIFVFVGGISEVHRIRRRIDVQIEGGGARRSGNRDGRDKSS